MKIKINGVEEEVPEEAKLGEFLGAFSEELKKENMVIASLKVNGQEPSADEETQFRSKSFQQLGDVEVFTVRPSDLAYETLSTLGQYVDLLIHSVQKASEGYKKKNYITADAHFSKAIDGLDLFVQTVGGVKLALKVGLDPKIALTEASLVSIMQDLLQAKRQNNYVFLADLLQNDLVENLVEWRDQVFPILNNHGTT